MTKEKEMKAYNFTIKEIGEPKKYSVPKIDMTDFNDKNSLNNDLSQYRCVRCGKFLKIKSEFMGTILSCPYCNIHTLATSAEEAYRAFTYHWTKTKEE